MREMNNRIAPYFVFYFLNVSVKFYKVHNIISFSIHFNKIRDHLLRSTMYNIIQIIQDYSDFPCVVTRKSINRVYIARAYPNVLFMLIKLCSVTHMLSVHRQIHWVVRCGPCNQKNALKIISTTSANLKLIIFLLCWVMPRCLSLVGLFKSGISKGIPSIKCVCLPDSVPKIEYIVREPKQ